mmetsp:Transcript_50555/g.130257  ORF Transcript_50555/g.130257 Transcript_50555/m.130257 type:complete len:268 (+) Transcript_50555:901-1704(+)
METPSDGAGRRTPRVGSIASESCSFSRPSRLASTSTAPSCWRMSSTTASSPWAGGGTSPTSDASLASDSASLREPSRLAWMNVLRAWSRSSSISCIAGAGAFDICVSASPSWPERHEAISVSRACSRRKSTSSALSLSSFLVATSVSACSSLPSSAAAMKLALTCARRASTPSCCRDGFRVTSRLEAARGAAAFRVTSLSSCFVRISSMASFLGTGGAPASASDASLDSASPSLPLPAALMRSALAFSFTATVSANMFLVRSLCSPM